MAPLEDVYMTLVMSDSYLPGAAVLAHSLRDAGTKKKLACLITIESLSADTVTELRGLYDFVIPVPRIVNPNPGNLYLMDRGDLLFTFTKINLWRQVQFRKIVYIDADVVALRAPDELFDIQERFAAAPDAGWPDAFNTGVMVISPDEGEYRALQTLALSGDSFDGADQGLLNQYFEHQPWHRISFTYNCTPSAEYQWEPAYRYHKSNIKMVHFIGRDKPWTQGRYFKSSKGIYNELQSRWWAVYDRHLKSSSQEYTPGQSFAPSPSAIRYHVAGEATDIYGGVPPEEQLPPLAPTEVAPLRAPESKIDFPAVKVEQSLIETGEREEILQRGSTQPPLTTEVRRYSAPQAEWDATRAAPPQQSKPEAANFPTWEYTFSDSRELFHAPSHYPEPPKDMYYKVPEEKPKPEEPPKPIFPWEREAYRPKPTRVFAEDVSLPPQPPAPQAISTPSPEDEVKSITSGLIAAQPTDDVAFQPFHPQPNAWDNVQSIERYVRAVMDAQTRRTSKQQQPDEIVSPSSRRESLILTDFPTADDRPSLPVTPAPIRRPTFWGEERDEAGELPPAEGVPEQADWVCPQCGFSASSPVAFYHARRKSSTAIGSAPLPRPGAKRSSAVDFPPLPQHLRTHRPSTTSEASTCVFSATSTAVQSVYANPTTAMIKPESAPSPPAVPSAVASLRRASRTSSEDLPAEQAVHVLLDPLLPTSDHAPTPPPEFNPTEKLEQLRRNSLVEYEHLKAPRTQREIGLRDLPEHSVMAAAQEEAGHDGESTTQPSEKHASYFSASSGDRFRPPSGAAKLPGGGFAEPQRAVALEQVGQEHRNTELSPTAAAVPSAPISSTTAAAEFSGAATGTGAPVFDEPDFEAGKLKPFRRSAGSFSAESALEAENFSPTER